MGALEEGLDKMFQEIESAPYNHAIRKWKDQGKKVVGWLCSYTPEELIYHE